MAFAPSSGKGIGMILVPSCGVRRGLGVATSGAGGGVGLNPPREEEETWTWLSL